ncbi:uncharacterized protein LOC135377349 [Ornithodoros turicata]|uniref:uncharacterized protein LOC135377349 n=1 Tax=Ornithodoros turicata TaxID=34597 RepID=UPI00313A0577
MSRTTSFASRRLQCICLTFSLFLLFALSSLSHSSMKFESLVSLPSPKQAWDYVADLNHMWTTNPGLIDFTIQSSGGSHPVWEYDVLLNERLSPYGILARTAHYVVEPADAASFRITTTASFCKFHLLCASTKSVTTFAAPHARSGGTQLRDTFTVSMTPLLAWLYGHEALQLHHRGMLDRIVGQLEKGKRDSPGMPAVRM